MTEDLARIEETIEVDQPISTAYNQWTQFEEFPKFMEGVTKVVQKDDRHLRWEADIGLAEREWDAEIIQQKPDELIEWRATGEVRNEGRVSFQPIEEDRTRVTVVFGYDPDGFVEKAGDMLGVTQQRVRGDLKRFKKFIEQPGGETGAWRGEIG